MQIEIKQIERRYAALRIIEPNRQARLTAALAEQGQHSPVLVVASGDEDRYVLIDGYARLAALERLGHDVVEVLVLGMEEAPALIFAHRLASPRAGSVLEEAWLVRELVEGHGKTQSWLAVQLGRTVSWVSRRLALVRLLPASVHEAVRSGRIAAHAAMKSLVPLARANPKGCARLIEQLGCEPVSVRQLDRLYRAWRSADDEQRQRIIEQPRLYLKAAEELEQIQAPPLAGAAESPAAALLKDIGIVAAVCRRACQRLAGRIELSGVLGGDVRRAFGEARLGFAALSARLDQESAQ